MKPSFYVTLLILLVSLTVRTFAQQPAILVVSAAGSSRDPDIKAKLVATNQFRAVDIFDAKVGTPTLSQLMAYDAALVCSDSPFKDPAAMGNVLADYIDAGRGVVRTVFANTSSGLGIKGRFDSDTYKALSDGTQTAGQRLTLGTVALPEHPTMKGVTSFDGGSASYRSTGSLLSGATLVASWSDGSPLVAVKTGVSTNQANIVDLNFLPPSSTVNPTFWVASTDGGKLMANALTWAATPATLINDGPLTCSKKTITLTATAGRTNYVFSGPGLNQSSAANTIQVSQPGTYSVTFLTASGLTATAQTVVAAPSSLLTSGSQTNLACANGTNGSATVAVNGGTAPYSYVWKGSPSTTATASNLSAGNYTVAVTDANGCQITREYIITQPATVVAATSSVTNVSCFGGNNGSITLTPNGGVAPYTYSWENGAATKDRSGLVSGAYKVVITDANGCSITRPFTITQPTALATTGSQVNPSAYGASDGSAIIAVTGGTAPYQYAWVPSGGTNAAASGLLAGAYKVTVTDANNCQATREYTLTQPVPLSNANLTGLSISAGALTPLFTSATTNYTAKVSNEISSISLIPTVDTYATIKINSTSVKNQSVTSVPLAVGNNTITIEIMAQDGTMKIYTITVLRDKASQTITFDPIPAKTYGNADFTLNAVASSGRPVTYTSGDPAVATIDAQGKVHIVGAGGIKVIASQAGNEIYQLVNAVQVLLVKPAPLTIQADDQCKSGDALPKLTLTYAGFVNGETEANLSKQPTVTTTATAEAGTGTYPITVGGAESANYAITYKTGTLTIAQASLSVSGPITCANPTVTLTAAGGANYQLGDEQTNETGVFTVSKAGDYKVLVTTTNGCRITVSATVYSNVQNPSVTLTNDGPITCTNPTVKLTATPTVPNCGAISYAYSGPGLSDPNAVYGTTGVTVAGVYSVTLTDEYGCTATAETTVKANQDLPTVILTSDGALSCTKTSVTLLATGGVSYQFDGGAIQQKEGNTAVVTKAGVYSVKATSANGCTASKQITVTGDQTLPTVTLLASGNLSCSQPIVTLTASGGTSYQFSAGAKPADNGNTATVATAGTYSVTVTGPNGCTASAETTITGDQTAPGVTLSHDGTLSCTNTTVLLTASGAGSYRFSAGATQLDGGNTARVSAAGVYSVTITAANGCTATAETTVQADQTLPTISLANDGPLTCSKTTGKLMATGTGTYRFSAGATQLDNGPTATVSTGGVYSVTVTGANGCSAIASTTVPVNTDIKAPALTVSATTTDNQPIQLTASGCEGTISWTVNGGTGVASGAVYTVAQPGNYTLTARCTVGICTSDNATPVTVSIRPGIFAIASVNTVNCQLVDASRGEYWVTFTPVYSGLSGNPASFSIINEIVSTTATAPYTVRLYADNPVVTLVATQTNGTEAQFAYSWRAVCAGTPTANRAPVVTAIPAQQLLQEQPYQLDLTRYFADPDGQVLTFTTSKLPAGLSLSGGRISGIPTESGVSDVTVTAVDPAGLQVSAVIRMTVTPTDAPSTTGFAITGVSNVTCVVVTASERRVSFSPLYSGLNGSPIRFRVVNEIDATTDAGPYAVRLYTDNPVVKLEAVQSGVTASYSYAWLSGCNTPAPPTPTPPSPVNRPPVVSIPLVDQTATVGQGYSLYISRNTFSDPDGGALTLSAGDLPAGLSYSTSLSAVTGTPASVGTSTIWITATDPSGLSVSTSFELTVIAAPVIVTPTPQPTEPTNPPASGFAITGVSNVTCVVVTASERRVSFSPLYSGLNGSPIRFRVVNEIDATTDAGPYAVRLYTDNPVVKLEAVQSGVTASYSYAWLSGCNTPAPPTTPTTPTPPVVTTPTTPVAADFAITGVATANCEVITASERRVTFMPMYSGAGTEPISFQVINEVDATTAPGPYTIRLYTDNPAVTLRAEQGGKVASFRYEWLKVCNPNSRQGVAESIRPLQVMVLGNPVVGEMAEIEISGADGQSLKVQITDLLGYPVHQQQIRQATASERVSLPLGRSQGILLLNVSTPTQRQQIKLIRP